MACTVVQVSAVQCTWSSPMADM